MPKKVLLNKPGQKYHDFIVVKSIPIPELQCELKELVHEPTGAQVMHLANDDAENLFCLSFRTIPENSNGVAHILEHTVLCGSEKYPIKDPFFCMTRRSLNTYMNALTGADFTCYPAATAVPKDFYNLLEVYLDAVFKPNIEERSFLQEGHRLEFTDPDDINSPLVRKGIVFNEMKGALASSNARLAEAMNAALFPDLTYGHNSGGDPKDIPSLTYQELCAFYQKHYHPSRCLFFFYGNMPLEKHLDFIEEHALKNVKKVEQLPELPMQPRFEQPKQFELHYPIAPDEDLAEKTLISFGWLTCHVLKQQEVLALSVLEIILLDTDASPLKHALLRSGYCKQVSAHMELDTSEVPLIITLRGCEPEHADALENVIRTTLRQIIQNGISLEMFDSAMHQLEIAKSEIVGNHSPFGLYLFFRSGLLKQHGGFPEDGLQIHALFDQLRKKNLEDPTYLTGLLKKYLLDNPHNVRIVMIPNQELAAKEEQAEQDELKKKQEEMNSAQKKQIIQKMQMLAEYQKEQENEDAEILPKIQLTDVPTFSKEYPLEAYKIEDLNVYHHNCFTNDIIYCDMVFDLPYIKHKDLPLVRLLTILLPQLGCGDRNYLENLEYIQAHTGGIASYLNFNINVHDYRKFLPSLHIRGKSLHRKANKLFALMHDFAMGVDLSDKDRIKEILQKHYTGLHSTLNQNALKYAIMLSSSGLDVSSMIANTWYGLDYYWFIKEIVENLDERLPELIKKLSSLQDLLIKFKNPDIVVGSDASTFNELKKQYIPNLVHPEVKPSDPWKNDYKLPILESQGRIIASPVAFTSHVFKTLPYVHHDTPALNIAACLFENLFLHPLIREQGGAYSGGATNNSLTGSLCFYSYRDPNISKTLSSFEKAIKLIGEGQFEESDLEEAKLEIIQDLDAPVAPGSRADLAYSRLREGKSQEVRQQFRNRLLNVTKKDIIDAIAHHIEPRYQTGVTVVFAGRELLERENELLHHQHHAKLILEGI